ncbi:MAG TPA: copper chaperone [Ferruginibacter sp.]|nr:copper chaperone [Ferruginibacter sp.]
MEILVFKTNLNNTSHINKVKPALNRHPFIKDWNVDLQDCDKILRVVTDNIASNEIEKIILNTGYECKELK